MASRYILIGCGVAGAAAAEAIRAQDPKGEVHVFTNEKFPFYTRIRLPEILSGRAVPEKLVLKDAAWFQSKGIHLHLGEKAAQVAKAPLRVMTDKEEYAPDRLLLATGGYAFLPSIPGAQLEGVYTLRNLEDANRIAMAAANVDEVLLIGGGLLGLEAGNGLRLRGKKVHVAEVFDRLLPRQMDSKGASILQRAMERMGFEFYLGVKVREIVAESGRSCGLLLEDGRFIDAEMVIVSAGTRPHLDLAQQLGLEIHRGIVVDDRMETSLKDVFAAGDAVEHRGIYYGLWPAAEEQGRVAGTNMAGGDVRYQGTLISNKLKVVGIDLVAAGEIDSEEKLECEIVLDDEKGIYRKVVYRDDLIVGCILLGDITGQKNILKAIGEGISPGPLKGRVLQDPSALN